MRTLHVLLFFFFAAAVVGCSGVSSAGHILPPPVQTIRDPSVARWRNIYDGDARLAGVKVQQFPDNEFEAPRWEGKHPAMILFVFWDGRVRQRGYSPSGTVEEDFWWHITPARSYIWQQLDYSKGSDPDFRYHADPRKHA